MPYYLHGSRDSKHIRSLQDPSQPCELQNIEDRTTFRKVLPPADSLHSGLPPLSKCPQIICIKKMCNTVTYKKYIFVLHFGLQPNSS